MNWRAAFELARIAAEELRALVIRRRLAKFQRQADDAVRWLPELDAKLMRLEANLERMKRNSRPPKE